MFRFDSGRAVRILRFQPEANLAEPIMNASLVVDNKRTILAAGMGKQCHLFSFRYKLEEKEKEERAGDSTPKGATEEERKRETENGELRKRKGGGGEKGAGGEKGGEELPAKEGKNGFVNHGERILKLQSQILCYPIAVAPSYAPT